MISIIVPVFNAAPYLPRCLDSILAQTERDFELILINDGSDDDSDLICSEYAQRDSRIRYICQENHGVSFARNRGMQMASGEYVCMFDSDDEVDCKMLERMKHIMENTDDCQLVVCGICEHMPDGSVNHIVPDIEGYIKVGDLPDRYPRLLRTSLINSCANKLYRRDKIVTKQETTMCLGEDLLFNMAYIRQVNGVFFMGDELYHYMIRNDSLNRAYRPDMLLQMEKLYVQKKEFCRSLGFGSEMLCDVATTYMTFVIYGLTSLYRYADMGRKKRRKVLKKIVCGKTVRDAVRTGKPEKGYQRILYPLFRMRCVFLLDTLFTVRAKGGHSGGGNS